MKTMRTLTFGWMHRMTPTWLMAGGLAAALAGSAWGQSYSYDVAGRLTQVAYDGAHIIYFQYDTQDNLLNLTVSAEQAETDTDADTLPDAWEYVWFNTLTNTAAGDYNRDGHNNHWEFGHGTDPTATNTAPRGAVRCTLEPAGARADGARWQLVDFTGADWMTSGQVMTNLPSGVAEMAFKPVSGWQAPATRTFSIPGNQQTNLVFTYVCAPAFDANAATMAAGAATGTLAVAAGSVCPWTASVTAGAGWLSLLGSTSGTGPGALHFAVTQNTGGGRVGMISLDGCTLTVWQIGRGGAGPAFLLLLQDP